MGPAPGQVIPCPVFFNCPTKNLTMKLQFIPLSALCLSPLLGHADSFLVSNTTADALLASGSPGNPVGSDLKSKNFGGLGALAIAPASSTKGEFDTVLKFNLSGAASHFDTTFGPGNWKVSGLTLSLASNFGAQGEQPSNALFNSINGGAFNVTWLSNDSWVEGSGGGSGSAGFPGTSAVSFNSIPDLLSGQTAALGSFAFSPPGDNVYASYALPSEANFLADATSGGDVSLYLSPADNQVGYLFNSRSFSSGHPELTVNASPVPEPSSLALLAAFGGLIGTRFWRRKSA